MSIYKGHSAWLADDGKAADIKRLVAGGLTKQAIAGQLETEVASVFRILASA